MSEAGVSCELWVGTAHYEDTGADYAAATPTALAGLSVTWGRSTNVDQPATSTCSFTVADKDGDADFLDRLHVGRPILVYAAGGTTAGAPTDIAVDGDFEADLTHRSYAQRGTVAAATIAASGVQALRLTPAGASSMTVWLPPAAFDDADITAWDALPQVSPGDTWAVTLAVRLGYGQDATVAVATFPNPGTAPGTVHGAASTVAGDSPLVYQDVTDPWTAPDGLGIAWAGARFALRLHGWTETGGTWDEAPGAWADWGAARVDQLRVMAPDRAVRRVQVFSGRITDLNTDWAGDHLEVACIAADWTADLANDVISHSWAAQPLEDRVASILGLATKTFEADVDTGVGSRVVSRVAASGSTVLGLLADLATTADGVLWPAFHETRPFYLWYEDPAGRIALVHLVVDSDSGLVVIEARTRPVGAVNISACDIERDSVAFTQTTADVLTRIDVSWLDQSVSGDPGEVHEHIVDTAREVNWGQRGTSYSTLLTSASDALDVAGRVLNRSDELGWHASGLVWDTIAPAGFDDTDRDRLLTLLDGTQRPGAAIVVHELPGWAPGAPILDCYLEGGTYSYESARWTLNMNISPSGETGHAVHWAELDETWAWDEFDPSIAWLDLYGVKGP
jgi:hypothetical protein